MKAMILAAGRGERMRPLTDTCPKPMLEAGGVPLIVRHIQKLRDEAGICDIVINTAWLPEVLHNGLGDGSRFGVSISWSDEIPGGLETAGGIKKALPLLGKDPFLVVNGDCLMTCRYDTLARPLPAGISARVFLAPNPPHHPEGDFSIVADGLLSGEKSLTFTGAAVYTPGLFSDVPEGKIRLAPYLRKWAREGLVLAEEIGGLWLDVGTPERLRQADRVLTGGIGGNSQSAEANAV